jgi:pteridine reductase
MSHRVAFITGSGKRRVGAVIAEMLARKGYDIALHYRTSSTEAEETALSLRQFNVDVSVHQADLTNERTIQEIIQAILKQHKRIDVLVNCAAIWKNKKLEDITAEDVREHFEINTLGSFLCAQQVGLTMVKQSEGGVIINFGDWAEIRPYLNYAAYFPSKGAVSAMTRSLAVEFASRNPKIRVNAILPGPVMLPPDLPQAERDEAINATLVKHEGSPQNVAQAVWALIENDFLTGVLLPVDGGRTIFGGE